MMWEKYSKIMAKVGVGITSVGTLQGDPKRFRIRKRR